MTDLPALLVNIGIFVVSGVSALAAIVSVISSNRARNSKVDAEKARDRAVQAQQESADALQRANLISQAALDAQKLALPPAWGKPEKRAGTHKYSVQNTSGRTVVVSGIDLKPGGNIYVFDPPRVPIRVQHGDSVPFGAMPGGSGSSHDNVLILQWTFEDDPAAAETTERRF
ncbi:hypothetical protein ABS642_03440 [Microbacterium sp. A8/3-1]|uniref:Secreted protein n=1 Tax=Microbacterium sp. A8/3-1 TaxID=3160749 RepID=A0AAU7W044_9MICO